MRIIGLDITRSVAILLVMFCHSSCFYTINNNCMEYIFTFAGVWGVELFFALSGFLIGGIIIKNIVNVSYEDVLKEIKIFWIRRWFRTLPLYYLIIIFNIFFWFIVNGRFGGERNFSWEYLFFLQNYAGDVIWFCPETWSLSLEEWFYFIFPIVILLAKKYDFSFVKLVVCFGLLIIISRIIYIMYCSPSFQIGIRANTFLRLDSFAIGVFSSYIFLEKKELWRHIASNTVLWLNIIFMIAIVLMPVYFNLYSAFFEIDIVKMFVFDLTSIIFLAVVSYMYNVSLYQRHLVNFFTVTSKISYSLYLIHIPVFLTARYVLIDIVMSGNAYIINAIAIVFSYFIAYIIYNFYEKPIMDLRDNFTR